jgi:hypothetical protein
MNPEGLILGITISLATFAAGSIGSGSPSHANQAQSATPRVNAEFQPEVSQLTAGGLRLKEAVEASLEGSGRHLAAIFQRENPKSPKEAFEFRIIESDGLAPRTIFKRTDFFFSFMVAGEPNKLNATDINGDAIREIIVQSSSGGNCWSCNPTEIYQVRNHKAELLAAAPVQKLADLNGDGIQELLVTDTRWESYADLSHAASPGAAMVYAWRNSKYIYASRDYGDFYKSEISRLRASIDEAKAQITAEEYSDELYVGLSIGLALTYAHLGEIERGLKEMEVLLNSNAKSPAQTRQRLAIINDFRKGESGTKLQQMKYADPLPF